MNVNKRHSMLLLLSLSTVMHSSEKRAGEGCTESTPSCQLTDPLTWGDFLPNTGHIHSTLGHCQEHGCQSLATDSRRVSTGPPTVKRIVVIYCTGPPTRELLANTWPLTRDIWPLPGKLLSQTRELLLKTCPSHRSVCCKNEGPLSKENFCYTQKPTAQRESLSNKGHQQNGLVPNT